MGIPHAWRVALDQKVNREEWEDGGPAVVGKADRSTTWYVMPFSTSPLPRPEYPGPVVMVVPPNAVPLITYDGSTEGGAGLVPGLDWVLVQEEEEAPPPGTTDVLPNSIASAVRLGAPRITTSTTATGILFGSNAGNVSGGSETVATKLSWFTRLPMVRWYYGMNALPATFNSGTSGGAPEKRVQISFKWQPSQVNAGQWDARFDSYFSSIPADYDVEATLWHEPNGELNSGAFSATEFKNAYYRLSNRLVALGLTHRIKIAPNFTFPRTGGGVAWSDSWVPDVDLLHDGAVLTWDTYGNPTGAHPLSGSTYPNMVTDNANPIFTKNALLGYQDNWGITEFNAPRRDGDPDESARVTCLDAFVTALKNAAKPPIHVLLWEGNGVQFDQNFYTDATKDWWQSWAIQSPT